MALQQREKKVIIIGGIVVFCITFYMLAIEPFHLSHAALKDDLVTQKRLLQQYKGIVANMEKQGGNLSSYESRHTALKKKLLDGNTPSIAAADLQKNLQKMITGLGITLDSIRVSSTKEYDSFIQVPVEVSIKCRIRKMKDLLYQIENNEKFLTISKIISRTIDLKNPRVLETRLEVSGFMTKS